MRKWTSSQGTDLHYVGPSLEEGPLPALFYFALSGEESLRQDPYNQPVAYLASPHLRIFSADLPYHGQGRSAKDAMPLWIKELSSGSDIITPFVDEICVAVEELHAQGALIPQRIAACGLSRGAFIAFHVAARLHGIRTLCGFAPLTSCPALREYAHVPHHPLFDALDARHLAHALCDRKLRFYIGNNDTRVGTRSCFHLVETLVEKALQRQVRSPAIELHILPSIGYMGHGTATETFHQGAAWLAKELGL